MTFPPPLVAVSRFSIANRSGKVRVIASARADAHVDGGTMRHQADGSIIVDPSRKGSGEIVLLCPLHSDVMVGTASGHVELKGVFGHVNVVTASGRIDVEQAATLDVRSASAAVHVGRCEGGCRVATTSGGIHIAHAGSADISAVSGKVVIGDVSQASVRTVNGTVSLAGTRGGRAHVRTVSGSVKVMLPSDATPTTALRSVSGSICCDPATGTDGEVDVKTISGSIRICIQ